MRWIGDECVSRHVVASLRTQGHDVIYIADAAPVERDGPILNLAIREGRLLLTEDKDFGDLVFRNAVSGAPRASDKWAALKAAIEKLGQGLFGHYVVVEDTRIRSRPLR